MIIRFICFFAVVFTVTTCQIIEKNETTIQPIEEKPISVGSQLDTAAFNRAEVEEAAARLVDAPAHITDEAIFQSSDSAITDVSTPFSRIDPRNPSIKLVLTEEDSKYLIFDSINDSANDTLLRRPLPLPTLRRHHLTRYPLFKETKESIWVGNLTASWHNEIPFDFFTNGYWMRLDKGAVAGSVIHAEVGTFVHGPELGETHELPTTGTVIYRGFLSGMYTSYYGRSWEPLDPRLVDGLKEVGESTGVVVFKVDFDKGTIEGCVGCVENQETTGVTADPQGRRGELYTNLSLASFSLPPTAIRQGEFRGTGAKIFLGDEDLGIEFEILDDQSSWSGKLTDRLITGTMAWELSNPDGSRSVGGGSFFATEVLTQ